MAPKTILPALIVFLTAALNVCAQSTDSTSSATKIVLNSDGTWEYQTDPFGNQQTTGGPFLKATWGMTKHQVKNIEKNTLLEEKDDILLYRGEVLSLDTYMGYIFANDRLVKSKWVIEQVFSDKNDYIESYHSLKDALIQQYGEPIKDEQPWRNDLYANEHQHWGFAISLGHMFYFSNWDSSETDVKLLLKGENFKIKLSISFTGKNLRFAGDDKENIQDLSAANKL